jgi:FkbM family methyltransferase
METDSRIGAWCIGARDGNVALPLPPLFQGDLYDVFFEADTSAVEQIQRRHDPARSRVFPYCLADENGTGTLLLNYDPYTSSLLPIASTIELAQSSQGCDYPHAIAGACVREVPVELRTLDSLDLLAGEAVAPPNVMLIDTQGSELAIMRGGRRLIADHTIAIIVEAEFIEVYEKQPLFGDLAAWLNDLGFFFADFAAGPHRAQAFGMPIGHRGRSLAAFSDALFFRRPATLVENPRLLTKLAFVAIALRYVAIGFHCLDLLAARDPLLASIDRDREYVRALFEMTRARNAMPAFEMPTFKDLYPTFADSSARFEATVAPDHAQRTHERWSGIQARLLAQGEAIGQLASEANTPIETVLQGYGLMKAWSDVRNDRLASMRDLLRQFAIELTAPVADA